MKLAELNTERFWLWLQCLGYERHPNRGEYVVLHYKMRLTSGEDEHHIIYRDKRNELTFQGAALRHVREFQENS